MSSAINIFLRSAVSYEGIPFEIRRQIPNETTIDALSEYTAMKNDPVSYKRSDSFDDLLCEVNEEA